MHEGVAGDSPDVYLLSPGYVAASCPCTLLVPPTEEFVSGRPRASATNAHVSPRLQRFRLRTGRSAGVSRTRIKPELSKPGPWGPAVADPLTRRTMGAREQGTSRVASLSTSCIQDSGCNCAIVRA